MIGAELSKVNVYPGERLYVKCTFQALEDKPIDCDVQLFADFLLRTYVYWIRKESRYYRVTASMYPAPAHWKKRRSVVIFGYMEHSKRNLGRRICSSCGND